METEEFKGVGRKNRRYMKKQWKASDSNMSLKHWARGAALGDIAYVWLRAKQGENTWK